MKFALIVGMALLVGVQGHGRAVAAGEPLELSGRLVDFDFDAPDCGTLRVVSLALYDQVEGTGVSGRVFVAVPCVELPRRELSASAGNLDRFIIGQRHRLRVVRADPATVGAVAGSSLHPGERPVYLARRVDLVIEKVVDARSVGGLNLGKPELFTERLRPAVRAAGRAVGRPGDYWAQIEPDRKTGELIFHLWQRDAFRPENRDLMGNPGGKCRDVYVRRKDLKVTHTLFWQ